MAAGLPAYFTGQPCCHSHIARRRTKTCLCLACELDKKAKVRPRYADKKNLSRAAWREKKKAEAAALGTVWSETDPEKMRRYRIEWLARNPDWSPPAESIARRKTANKAYVEANKNRISARKKFWYEQNKDRISDDFKKKYAENPEFYCEQRRKHSRGNLLLRRAENQRRRAVKRNAEGSFCKGDIDALFDKQRGICVGCETDISVAFHIDHKTPLSRGGSNWPANLQLLCSTCNLTKGSMTMEEWMSRKMAA